LGAFDPLDDRLITFDLDRVEPHLMSLVAFQVPITIKNLIIHHYIINEGESTFVMSNNVWKDICSSELLPSTLTLCDYDGHPSQTQRLLQNVPIELVGKMVMMNI
jgi:hypothetical protein